tara:strand:- start:37346 stop:37831 length:486 start_codon:yes stop_codon:yes gene_type:complete
MLAGSWQTVAAANQTARLSLPKADRVVVLKSERRLILMKGDFVLKIYPVALGRYPKGHKQFQGDAKTPEGEYLLDFKLRNSQFHRAIRINYPNARDVARARKMGKDPGGKIMIHGLPNTMSADRVGHPTLDWTQGCIAVTNRQMDEIWKMVDAGTPIEIHP